jgi:uncharacterized membrane protein YphA (DoxX/SURF4 family)
MHNTGFSTYPAARAARFYALYQGFLHWAAYYAIPLLRVGFGVLFLWLGLLKVLGVSPAEPLMRASMPPFVPMEFFFPFAGVWEVIIGLGFLTGLLPRITLLMTLATMTVTLSILWMSPGLIWRSFPFVLSFEGEYVVKDIVIAASALVLAATLRGRQLVARKQGTLEVSRVQPGGLWARLDQLEAASVNWAAHHSLRLLQIGYGVVFLWFGVVKLFPGMSATESLTAALVPVENFALAYALLGVSDMIVGLGLISGRMQRLSIALSMIIMVGSLFSYALRPDLMFTSAPFALTLAGQHMLKNLIFIGAAVTIWVSAGGGGLAVRRQ